MDKNDPNYEKLLEHFLTEEYQYADPKPVGFMGHMAWFSMKKKEFHERVKQIDKVVFYTSVRGSGGGGTNSRVEKWYLQPTQEEDVSPEWQLFFNDTKMKILERNIEIANKALNTIVDMAEDPLASDNPMIHAYMTTARIAKDALNNMAENNSKGKTYVE